ncbi:hypothetical protein FO519_009861, partial [Halicephalobus sp. NKZ332]
MLPFYHLPIIKYLNCGLLFENSSDGSRHREKLSKQRVIYEDELSLKTDCDSIRSRGYFPKQALTEEKNFPIAFARIVYKDYYLLEYAPQNFYYYPLDSQTDRLFKNKRLNTLESIKVTKSLAQVSISREAVDYVFDELNFHSLIRKLELKQFGVDETFWATLNTNDILNLPGGFTTKFIEQKIRNYMVARYT